MEEGYFFQTICNGFKFQFILMMNVKRSFPDTSQMEWFVPVVPEQQLVMYEEKNSMKCFKMKSHLDFLLNLQLFFPMQGDSGGPLVCPDANGERKLVGLVSFGYTGCTDAGVYTKVSHYEDWIQERVIA